MKLEHFRWQTIGVSIASGSKDMSVVNALIDAFDEVRFSFLKLNFLQTFRILFVAFGNKIF